MSTSEIGRLLAEVGRGMEEFSERLSGKEPERRVRGEVCEELPVSVGVWSVAPDEWLRRIGEEGCHVWVCGRGYQFQWQESTRWSS